MVNHDCRCFLAVQNTLGLFTLSPLCTDIYIYRCQVVLCLQCESDLHWIGLSAGMCMCVSVHIQKHTQRQSQGFAVSHDLFRGCVRTCVRSALR